MLVQEKYYIVMRGLLQCVIKCCKMELFTLWQEQKDIVMTSLLLKCVAFLFQNNNKLTCVSGYLTCFLLKCVTFVFFYHMIM